MLKVFCADAAGMLDTAPTCFPARRVHHCVCSTENFKLWSFIVFLLNERWLVWGIKYWMLGSPSPLHPRLFNGRSWCRPVHYHNLRCALCSAWPACSDGQTASPKHCRWSTLPTSAPSENSPANRKTFTTLNWFSQKSQLLLSTLQGQRWALLLGGYCWSLWGKDKANRWEMPSQETEPHLSLANPQCAREEGLRNRQWAQGKARQEVLSSSTTTTASRAGLHFGAGLLLLVGRHAFPPPTKGSFSGWARAARGFLVLRIWGPQRPQN